MARLNRADLQTLLDGVRELYANPGLDTFPDTALAVVRALVPGGSYSYNAVDLPHERIIVVVDPPDILFPGGPELLAAFAHQHPLITRYARYHEHPAAALSDFLSAPALHRLGLYGEIYRFIGIEDQLAIGLSAPRGTMIGITVNRDRASFTARDRLILDLLRPHLAQAYATARMLTASQIATNESGHMLVVLGAHQEIAFASDGARQLLAHFFVEASQAATLPTPLTEWVGMQQHREMMDADAPPSPHTPLVIERDGRRLVVRYIPGVVRQRDDLLLLKETTPPLATDASAVLDLTHREREILQGVVTGRSNMEIAAHCAISVGTVKKHLEHIYAKLGVGNRAAAINLAFAASRHGAHRDEAE